MLNKVTHKRLEVTCPFAIYLKRVKGKDKRVPINLNWYRNAHHRESNEVKIAYKHHMASQLKDIGLQTPVRVTYQVFKPTRRILDKHNVDSISKKFLYDAMTEYGVWIDDNDEYVKTERTLPTVHDKDNPRVEVVFESIEE